MFYKGNPELQAELDKLNLEVEAAVAKRTAWMDAHMGDFCDLKVGDAIYDLDTGRKLGEVVELYRYWGSADRDWRYDTRMTVDVRYNVEGERNTIDNTSRQIGAALGTKADAERRAKARWESIARS